MHGISPSLRKMWNFRSKVDTRHFAINSPVVIFVRLHARRSHCLLGAKPPLSFPGCNRRSRRFKMMSAELRICKSVRLIRIPIGRVLGWALPFREHLMNVAYQPVRYRRPRRPDQGILVPKSGVYHRRKFHTLLQNHLLVPQFCCGSRRDADCRIRIDCITGRTSVACSPVLNLIPS